MIRLVRVLGLLMMVSGGVILLTYLVTPLRALWPWFRSLPLPIQLGLGAAALGLVLLFGTVLWERLEARAADRALREDL